MSYAPLRALQVNLQTEPHIPARPHPQKPEIDGDDDMKELSLIRRFLVISVSLLTFTSCTSSSVNSSNKDEKSIEKANDLKYAPEAKETIDIEAQAYIDYNCSPIYKVNPEFKELGKQMRVYNEARYEIDGYPGTTPEDKYFLIEDTSDSRYAKFAVRTVYLASLFHQRLADIYTDIYVIYGSEMKTVRRSYESYKKLADKSSKICAIAKRSIEGEALDASDNAKVQALYEELEANWSSFQSWAQEVEDLSARISAGVQESIKEMNTPKCTEYPTADGKYTVIKCVFP